MLKGSSFNLPFTLLIAIVAMLGVFFAGILFIKSVGDSAKVTVTTMGYLNTVDAAHFVDVCLREGRGYMLASDLDAKSGSIGDLCKDKFPMLSDISARAKVIDLEKKIAGEEKTWSFGWSVGSRDPHHQIYVNIKDGNDIHVGRLYVQTET